MKTPAPILIVGPSGVGKSVVISRLLSMFPDLEAYRTTTTRPPRGTETKYHFVSRDEFERLIQTGEMLEWAEVHGNFYGVQRARINEVMQKGKWPIALNGVDVQGVSTYRSVFPNTLAIFISFSSLDELEERLRSTRPGISETEIATRRKTAENEMAMVNEFRYVVQNEEGRLDETVNTIAHILEEALGLHRV